MNQKNTIELLLGRGRSSLRRLVIIASVGLLAACGGGDVSDDQRRLPLAVTTQAAPVYDRDDLYRFFSIAFGAAPGVTYMGQLVEAADYGLSIKQIVNIFTTKPQFLETYPATLSNREYAQKLVDTVVGTSASAAAKAEAVEDIVAALSLPDWTRGDITYAIFNNLAKKPADDVKWSSTAKKMANQVAYAKHFTEAMKVDTTDLKQLRAVVMTVTENSPVNGTELSSLIQKAIQSALAQLNLYNAGIFSSLFGESLVSFPYTNSSVSSHACAGSCSQTVTIDVFRLQAVGGIFTISDLSAVNLTPGSTANPSFSNLTNGQVIESGQNIRFELVSTLTKGSTVKLKYSFKIPEISQTFAYDVELKTN